MKTLMVPNWLTWASVSAALVSIGYGASYLTGLIYHQTYLLRLEIPSEFFRKQSSDYFVFAYIAWVELSMKLLPALMGDWRPLVLLTLFVTFTLFLGMFLGWMSETVCVNKIKENLKASPKISLAGSMLFMPITAVAVIFIAPIMLIVVTVIPILIGGAGADEAAKRELEKFEAGCDAKSIKHRCYDITEGEKFIARGFIVEVSDSYVALMTKIGPEILPLSGRSLKIYGKRESGHERK